MYFEWHIKYEGGTMGKTVSLENIMKLLPCEEKPNNSNMKETVFTVAWCIVYTLIMSSVPLIYSWTMQVKRVISKVTLLLL